MTRNVDITSDKPNHINILGAPGKPLSSYLAFHLQHGGNNTDLIYEAESNSIRLGACIRVRYAWAAAWGDGCRLALFVVNYHAREKNILTFLFLSLSGVTLFWTLGGFMFVCFITDVLSNDCAAWVGLFNISLLLWSGSLGTHSHLLQAFIVSPIWIIF